MPALSEDAKMFNLAVPIGGIVDDYDGDRNVGIKANISNYKTALSENVRLGFFKKLPPSKECSEVDYFEKVQSA